MPIKIRLQRHGAKRRPFYFIVVADENAPRDGKFIEKIGSYNPLTVPATVLLKSERALHWLEQGAKPTETVRKILSFKGVLYLKHLIRGVKLGIFDEETALKKFEDWKVEHEKDVMDKSTSHKEKSKAKRDDVLKASAVAKKVKVEESQKAAEEAAAPAEDAPAETEETADDAPEAEVSTEDAPAEEAPVAEAEEENKEADDDKSAE